MDAAYLSALAALAGSTVGGLTSLFSSWLGQSAQQRSQLLLFDKGRRQDLYRDFIDQVSQLYIDALTNDKPALSRTVSLYALVNRMRVVSSPEVVEEAEKVARLIVGAYRQPNKTIGDLHGMIEDRSFDALRRLSEACREELQGLARLRSRIAVREFHQFRATFRSARALQIVLTPFAGRRTYD